MSAKVGQTNYSLNVFKLHSDSSGEVIDIRPDIIGFEFFEDIHQSLMTGQVDFAETFGLVELAPIIGEEWIEFEIEVHGIHRQGSRVISGEMDVYKVADEQSLKNKNTSFRLLLVSRKFKENAKRRNRKAHLGTQDAIVSLIVEEQLKGEMIRVDPCEIEENYIFPNWHPISCIKAMTKNAISKEFKDPDYCFFEDFDGFHFCSTSFMIEQPIIVPPNNNMFKSAIIVNWFGDHSDFNVEEHHKKHSFDMIDNMNKGLYGSTLIHHDLVNRRYRESTQNYFGTFEKFKHVEDIPLLSVDGAGFEKAKMQYIPAHGIDNPGSYIDEVMIDQRKDLSIRQNQTEQNLMVLEVDGMAVPVRIGYPLEFELKSINGVDNEEDHEKLHGKFLIAKIRHQFTLKKYKQYVEISKDGYFF